MKTTSTLAALALATSLVSSVGMAAQFYKWTDEQGVTHYSADPPPASAGKGSEVKVSTKLPSGAKTALESQQKAATEKTGKDGKDVKPEPGKPDEKKSGSDKASAGESKADDKYAERCKLLKENMETLKSRGKVKEEGPDGNLRALSDEEKQQREDDTARQIKAFCEG